MESDASQGPPTPGSSSGAPPSVLQPLSIPQVNRQDNVQPGTATSSENPPQSATPVEEPPLNGNDLVDMLEACVQTVQSDHVSDEDKKLAVEKIRGNVEDFYLLDKVADAAKATVQMFMHVFNSTTAVPFESPLFALRKYILELLIRFVPANGYACHTRFLEDLMCRQLVTEYEGNAVLMIKYLNDVVRHMKLMNINSLLVLVNDIRINIDTIAEFARTDTEHRMFVKKTFNAPQLQDYEYMHTVLTNLYFENLVKMLKAPPLMLLPPAKNSIKLVLEFTSLVTSMMHALKERMSPFMGEIINSFAGFISLEVNMANDKVQPENAAIFHEAQLRMLAFLAVQLRKTEYIGNTNYGGIVIQYKRQIVTSIRMLLRNLSPLSMNHRKDLLMMTKQLFNTDIRRELLDVMPDLCYEEHVMGPPCIMPAQLRSELFCIHFDLIHNVRTMLDWTTFQHVFVTVLRSAMDYTLVPSVQAVNWKTVLNILDACRKAEDAVYPQLTVGFNYDSARLMYENAFFAICQKFHTIITENGKIVVHNISNQNLKAEDGKHKPPVEMYTEGQSSDDDSDNDSLGPEYERKPHVSNELRPTVDLNSDQEDTIDEILMSTEGDFDDEGKLIVDGESLLESLRLPTKVYPMRMSKRFRRSTKDKKYAINFQHGPGLESVPASDESDDDNGQKEGYYEMQKSFHRKNPEAFEAHTKLREKIEAPVSDSASELKFEEKVHEFAMNCFDRGDLRMRLRRFEKEAKGRKPAKILPLTNPENNFQHVIYGFETVFPCQGKFDSESASVQMQPEKFPYSVSDLKLILRNLATSLKVLLLSSHPTDDLKSGEPSPPVVAALSDLTKNFILSLDLFTIVPIGGSYGFSYQTVIGLEEKEYVENFISIFHSIHPNVFERIFKQHLPLFFENSLRNGFIANMFITVITAPPLQASTAFVLVDFVMDNLHYATELDEDDTYRYFVYQRVLKATIQCMSALASQPQPYGFQRKIQEFFFKFAVVCIRRSHNLIDPAAPITSLRTIFRQCGTVVGEALYELFLPLFPSFLQWMSASQNLVNNDQIQDSFIEMCLSLPTRLSSLVAYMPMIADAAVNSFIVSANQMQNAIPVNPQGWRTLDLCLDNYYTGVVIDFLQPAGLARILECLYKYVAYVDATQMSIVLKMISKLSGLNHGSVVDVQKLTGKCDLGLPSPLLKVHFERSGQQVDSIITKCYKWNEMAGPPPPGELYFINRQRDELFNLEPVIPSKEPLTVTIPLQTVVTQCLNIIRTANIAEGHVQKTFSITGRSEAANFLLNLAKQIFQPELDNSDPDALLMKLAVVNNEIMAKAQQVEPTWTHPTHYLRPWRCDDANLRQFNIQVLTGLVYASANPDFMSLLEKLWEDMVDMLTTLAHLETGLGQDVCQQYHPISLTQTMDAFIIVDVISAIIQDSVSPRFLACALNTVSRMMQTALSFAPNKDDALNVPLFHHLLAEVCQLCARTELPTRNSAILVLQHLIEEMPLPFLHAGFGRMFEAILDVLHFGDDDYSQGCVKAAMSAGETLLDRVLSANVAEEVESLIDSDDDNEDVADEEVEEDAEMYVKEEVQDAEMEEAVVAECEEKVVPEVEDVKKVEPVNRIPEFILFGLKYEVSRRCTTSSFPLAEYLCKVIAAMSAVNTDVSEAMFTKDEVTIMFDALIEDFFTTNFQHRFIGIKLIKSLLLTLQENEFIDSLALKRLPEYVKVLSFMAQNRDEEVVTGANYATYHLQISPGGHLPPTSNTIKYDNGISFIERVKAFRGELASFMAVLTIHIAKSVAFTELKLLPMPIHLPDWLTAPHMVNLMFTMQVQCAMYTIEERQVHSIKAVEQILLAIDFPRKAKLIQEIIDNVASCKKIYQIHFLAGLVTSPDDFSPKQLNQILNNQENILTMLANTADFSLVEVKFFESFMNICYRAKVTVDDTFLTHIFTLLSRTRVINALTLGIADFFSPVARFLGALDADKEISFEWFTAIDRIQQESYRTVFRILAAHPDAKDLLGLWYKHDSKIADLLLHHVIKFQTTDTSIRVPEKCFPDVDHMMIHLLMQFCEAFPHFFAEVSNFPKIIVRFMLSRHFRGNYTLIDHGTDDRDSLKLTLFTTTKATVPEYCTNMIIHTLTVNPYEFNHLLCVCSTLPQVYFNDTSKLRNFFDNFLVPRMTLRWRRALLHFVNKKLNDLFTETTPADAESNNFCEFMQVSLGNLMNYVLYPAFSYAFDRFMTSMVLDGSNDDVLEREDDWQEVLETRAVNVVDMAKEFCLKSLSLYNEKHYLIRSELAHGILQFSVLLMQRASAHIHEPGMTVQSNDLQNVMQAAWPATSGGGVFTDKWLRAIGLFLLAVVMSAVTIKKDIIMQLYDTVLSMPDGRENPILQKTMFVLARHAVRRKDDCFTFFIDRIRMKLLEDGFNMIKIGNTLSMLANNYEDFFPARYLLTPTILFTLTRLQTMKVNSFPYLHDAVKTIVYWEEMRLAKANLFKSQSVEDKLPRISNDPAMRMLDIALVDQVAQLIIKLSFGADADRMRKMTPIFHKALHPRVFGRSLFLRLDKMLTPREFEINSPLYNNMMNTIMSTTKSLLHYVGTAPISNVYCFTVALQHIPRSVINTNHGPVMDTMVTFVTKLLELCREAEPLDRPSVKDFISPDKRFIPLYNALSDYVYKVSIRFAARPIADFNDVNVLLTMLKSVTAQSDYAYKTLVNTDVIDVGARMANFFMPSFNNDTDRYKHDLIITLLEVFTVKAELLSTEFTQLYLHNVIYKIVTRHENLPAKYHEPICKFLDVSVSTILGNGGKLEDISRQHMSVIGAIARHHTATLIKYPTLLGHYLNAVALIFSKCPANQFPTDHTELWLAFYTGLSCGEVEIREKFLKIFEESLPKTFFERLVYLFTDETWAFMPGNTFIAVIVNMLFRCVLNNNGPRPVAADPESRSNPQRVVPDVAPNAVFVEPEYAYRAPVYGVCVQKSEVVDADDMYPKPAPGGTFLKEDVEYESMHFEQICANYLYHMGNAQTHFKKSYKDVIDSFLKMIHEGDTCLAIFEDLIPSIWSSLTEDERNLFTEVTSQFMVMPIFNTCPSHVAHSVWNAVMRCDPPMPIDLTKIASSLTGIKFTTHALVRFEQQVPRTVDLHSHFMEVRRLYTLLKEDDQVAVTWKNFSLCESAYRAFALYSAGSHKAAVKAIKSAQASYKEAMGHGVQEITDEVVALYADFNMLTDLGTRVLKDNSRWNEVNKIAKKRYDVCTGVEAWFQNWRSIDDWIEIIRLSKIAKDSDCPKEMFISLVMTILGSLIRSTHELDQIFFTDSFEERLRSVIVERIRRLACYYGPDYVEVFSDLSVFTDIFELIGVMKELYSVDASKFNSRIDSPLKSVLSAWRLRSCSPSDPPEVASRYYQYRITFLWILNNVIQKIRPDFRNIYNIQFHLTPAYNIAETAMFKFKALCALGDYKSAREGLQWMRFVGYENSIDICSYMCKNMRALIKQLHRQPGTLTMGEVAHEITTFKNADLRHFGPDSIAQYAATMSYIYDMLGNKKRARANLQKALAIEMATKNATTVHSERFVKTLAVSQYEIFADSPTKDSANDAFEALLRSLNKNFVKNHRHVARGIWAAQNPITLCPDWMAALIPQIPTVVFLPFLENIIIEVVANQRAGMAFFACFIGQVYPLHVLHQLYRLMEPTKFARVIRAVRSKTSYTTEFTRFTKEGTPEGPYENNVFQTKPDVLSEREGAKGQLVTVFRGMLPKLLGKAGADRALLTVLYGYQPADVQAYADVLDALDNMEETPLEKALKITYQTYDRVVPLVREEIYTGVSKSQECMFELVKSYDKIQPLLAGAPISLFDFENMTVPEPPELKSLTVFNIFVTFIAELEEYITNMMNTISLAEVAPTLYNFTMARAKIPDFAFQHDPGYGQCFAVIENFAPQMRFVVKNLTMWKELDIRLSNGRVVTYRITSNKARISTNGNALMSLLNPALEKTCDTMKRSAVFRVPHAVPLRNVTLIEVQNKPVNKLTSKPAHVMTLAEIYCAPQPKRNIPELHPARVLAEYFTCIQEKVNTIPEDVDAMEVDDAPLDVRSAVALGIREFNAKQNNDRVRLWFLDYYNDLSTFAYVRKQIATQLGTFSALHWATQGSPITMDDILIDLDYGKVWFQNYHFTGENWKPNVRRKLILSKQLESFLGDALHGHFEMATVVVAKTLLRRGYEDYVRPLIADLEFVRTQGMKPSLFHVVNRVVEKQKEKLKALANFNALETDTIKLLINQTLDPLAFELQPDESYLFL